MPPSPVTRKTRLGLCEAASSPCGPSRPGLGHCLAHTGSWPGKGWVRGPAAAHPRSPGRWPSWASVGAGQSSLMWQQLIFRRNVAGGREWGQELEPRMWKLQNSRAGPCHLSQPGCVGLSPVHLPETSARNPAGVLGQSSGAPAGGLGSVWKVLGGTMVLSRRKHSHPGARLAQSYHHFKFPE